MTLRLVRRSLFLAVLASALPTAGSARAADDDGAYGRLDGDVELALAAGAAVGKGGPSFVTRASSVYLQTAGIYAQYADAFGAEGAAAARSIAVGLCMRPLFLARYGSDLERGPTRLDLFADSITLDLGTFWHAPPGGAVGRDPGLEVALGLELPILARASGPWVGARGALRWRREDLAGATSDSVLDRGALLSLSLAWHQLLDLGIVDAGDGPSR